MKREQHNQTGKIRVVSYQDEYAPALSEIVIRNLKEINSRDYSAEEIENHVQAFSPEKIREYARDRIVLVALDGKIPVGTLGVVPDSQGGEGDYVIRTVFILPEYHCRGIGTLLLEKGENIIRQRGGKKITIPASITAHRFYYKHGYSYRSGSDSPDDKGMVYMVKVLI